MPGSPPSFSSSFRVAIVENGGRGGGGGGGGGSHFAHDFEDSHNYGWSVEVKGFHWKTLIDNKNTEIDRLNGIYKNLLSGSGVKLLEGRGTLVDAHTVKATFHMLLIVWR